MRALLSVSDKSGIVEFAKGLEALGVEIISTGGTHKKREEAGVKVTVASVYNILSELSDNHIYARRLSAAGKMFFDAIPESHVHLYDRENHTYRDVVDEELSAIVEEHLGRRKFKGYSIEDIYIQFVVRPTKRKK